MPEDLVIVLIVVRFDRKCVYVVRFSVVRRSGTVVVDGFVHYAVRIIYFSRRRCEFFLIRCDAGLNRRVECRAVSNRRVLEGLVCRKNVLIAGACDFQSCEINVIFL